MNRAFEMDWLGQRALVSAAHPAVLCGGQSWSYAELDRRVTNLAGGLRAAGVAARQRVAVLPANTPEFIVLIHALIRLGAVLVALNLRLSADELAWQIDQADSDWLLYDANSAGQVAQIRAAGRVRRLGLDDLGPPAAVPRRRLDPDAPFAILFTSGTTGRPKGVVQTLGNHFWNAMASAFRIGTLPDDRWLLSIPLYHVGGLAIPLRCCLYGTTVVVPAPSEHFEAPALLDTMEKQAVTLVSLVPTTLQRLLDTQRSFPVSLRLILLGGAAAPPKLLERAHDRKLPVACTYGLTEAASQVATALPDECLRKPGSAGQALLFTRISIVGEAGRELPRGETGEIVVSGPGVMPGYYRQPDATAAVLRGGALHTGDLGYLDADGDLWVLQRRSDLIVSGGENIYPAEVERVLLEHPAVGEACVVGVADPEWGQKVAAAVTLKPGAAVDGDELQEFCRRHLAGYKLPRLIRILPELPHTASGKIRYGLVRRLWE